MQCSMFSDRMVRSDELLAWFFDVFCCCLLSCCVQNASRVVWKQHALRSWGCHGAYDLLPVWPCAPQQELYDNKQQVGCSSKVSSFTATATLRRSFGLRIVKLKDPQELKEKLKKADVTLSLFLVSFGLQYFMQCTARLPIELQTW